MDRSTRTRALYAALALALLFACTSPPEGVDPGPAADTGAELDVQERRAPAPASRVPATTGRAIPQAVTGRTEVSRSVADRATTLRRDGASASMAADDLRRARQTPSQVAAALIGAGYGAREVGDALRTELAVAPDRVARILADESLAQMHGGSEQPKITFCLGPNGQLVTCIEETDDSTISTVLHYVTPPNQAAQRVPVSCTIAPNGKLLWTDIGLDQVFECCPVQRIAGATSSYGSNAGYSGDGGPASEARLDDPTDVAVLADGSLVVADSMNNVVRRIDAQGLIATVAGNGTSGDSGDGGPATSAQLRRPTGVSLAPDGGFFIADAAITESGTGRIRKVSASGTISTFFEGAEADNAQLRGRIKISTTPEGGVLIQDRSSNRVKQVAPDGSFSVVAGTGGMGFAMEGATATNARFYIIEDVEALPTGFLLVDSGHHRIRRVDENGFVHTAAGSGIGSGYAEGQPTYFSGEGGGFSGDGGSALEAELDTPTAVCADASGDFVVIDSGNKRFRRVEY